MPFEYDGSYAYRVNEVVTRLETALKDKGTEPAKVMDSVMELIQMTKSLSFSDSQLSVYNLNYFFKYADEILATGKIGDYVACYFNMKRFSVVNQQVGREEASKLLNQYVLDLQEIIEGAGCVCRVHGDTFAMLFHREKLSKVVEHLYGSVVEVNTRGIDRIMLSAHAGYYVIPEECTNAVEIMDYISIALNSAKYVRKVPYLFYDAEIMKTSDNEKRVESMFWDAIANKEFMAYYQPKVMLKDYRLIGAEALCRWKHGDEMIWPDQFIPVLEKSHMICELDFYMLDLVCKDISRWLKEGRPVVRISVNMSRVHLNDSNFLEHILDIIDQNGVPHEYIEIELTETTTDVDFRELKQVVIGLRTQGVSVAVDDFGVGYSSLTLLREMPWKVLKIDRSFLPTGDEEDEENAQKKVLLKYIIGMAQSLGLECIAEGVETVEQVSLLKDNSCYLAQGYLFDRPIPVGEFEERLKKLV